MTKPYYEVLLEGHPTQPRRRYATASQAIACVRKDVGHYRDQAARSGSSVDVNRLAMAIESLGECRDALACEGVSLVSVEVVVDEHTGLTYRATVRKYHRLPPR